MAFTKWIDCTNNKLSLEQIIKSELLVEDADGAPAFKVITANDALINNLTDLRKVDLSNTAFAIKGTAGNLLGWNIINPNASAIYVKFYNKVAGSVVVASDAPVLTIMVKANDFVYVAPNCAQAEFSTAMSMRACTGLSDADITAPGAVIHINVKYK